MFRELHGDEEDDGEPFFPDDPGWRRQYRINWGEDGKDRLFRLALLVPRDHDRRPASRVPPFRR